MQVIFNNDCHILNWWYISIYFHQSNLIETNYQATSKIRDDKWLVSTKTLTRILYESITVHDICPNFWLQLVLGTSTWGCLIALASCNVAMLHYRLTDEVNEIPKSLLSMHYAPHQQKFYSMCPHKLRLERKWNPYPNVNTRFCVWKQ